MTRAGPGSATYADIVALPPGITGQIAAGELFTPPRPSLAHATVASVLGMDRDILVPDLAGWRRELGALWHS